MILLQKFNDISGKVLKPKKFQPPTSKKKIWGRFSFFDFSKLGFRPRFVVIWEKKFLFSPQKCKLELCMSNGSEVLIYLSFLLKEAVIYLVAAATPNKHMVAIYQKLSFSDFILFYNSKNRHLEFLNLSPQGLISSITNWLNSWVQFTKISQYIAI